MENNARPAAEFTLAPPAHLPAPLFSRAVTCDLASDFTLPDYLPEIRRLLRVVPTVLPESRYLSAASAEFGGVVEYLVTYAGADGHLWSTRLTRDYTLTAPIDADLLAQGVEPFADARVDSVVSRVTGPRKLNLRARLRGNVTGWGEMPIEPMIDGDPAPASLERLSKPCRAMRILRAVSVPIDLGDEMPTDGAGETRVIRADGAVRVNEAICGRGEVVCRGELILQLLTCMEQDGMASEPEMTVRKIPFETQVALPEAADGMSARGWGRCGDLAVQIEEGRICSDAAVWLEVEAADAEELLLTADLYATDGEITDPLYRDLEVLTPVRCGNAHLQVAAEVAAKDAAIDPAAEIVDVVAMPMFDAMKQVDGRCVFDGNCRMSVIYRLDGEYAAAEVTVPISTALECAEQADDFAAEWTVCGLRTRWEGEGDARKLGIEADLQGAIRLYGRMNQRVLDTADYRPDAEAHSCACVVCYPEPDDSIWSVCKRYRVSRGKMMEMNHLSTAAECDRPASLAGVSYLLI
ncbi:MAG: DUF3794 domain-containing protein [Clostridia bacterium]|nr:DUF3794 domain-containing protein [Clostridia bacterium]